MHDTIKENQILIYEVIALKKKSKKFSIILAVIVISIVAIGVAEKNNFLGMKTWGKGTYYVQIKENGEDYITKDIDDKEYIRYLYKMNAYNKNGKEIKVQFDSSKNLKLDAYLLLRTISENKKDYNTVHSYEEIPNNEVPSKAKEQLDK